MTQQLNFIAARVCVPGARCGRGSFLSGIAGPCGDKRLTVV